MADDLQQKIILVVQETLQSERERQEIVISAEDTMDSVPEWDSVAFMNVFLAINEAFKIEPDFDEAIHYTSIATLTEFLRSEVS